MLREFWVKKRERETQRENEIYGTTLAMEVMREKRGVFGAVLFSRINMQMW